MEGVEQLKTDRKSSLEGVRKDRSEITLVVSGDCSQDRLTRTKLENINAGFRDWRPAVDAFLSFNVGRFYHSRLHQITSLSCLAAFNLSSHHNPMLTAAVRNLVLNCRNFSYSGCTRCLGALEKDEAVVSGEKE
ncbi:hypothetical protein NE237_014818 [Protea cynaroides]|uniref:Uncharacterized protein n=1 Tax=Protea cynaroides TaxID=273540 RepID=A0A9Q0KCU0_9MAGN|nr:hypothetical protein NE237_014818 [Protea cynaroides]